ncbi:MAG TPA: tetratricopeptide repeat protein [Terriglobales bacterium]|nr:tetratricopeptide repeat protein [Terriglobales bacterium]
MFLLTIALLAGFSFAPQSSATLAPGSKAAADEAQQAFTKGNDALKANQPDKALESFDRALSLAPVNPEYHLGKCHALAALGKHNQAIPECSEALRLRPAYADALRDRGHYYLNLGNVAAGLADLRKAEKIAPNDRGVYYHLGVGNYIKGDFAAAANAFQKCLDLGKQSDETTECIAWLYPSLFRAGRKQDAAALLARFQPDPKLIGHPVWYQDRILLMKGDKKEEELLPEMNSEGNLSVTSVAYSIGLWHLLNGRNDKAKEYFEKAVATKYTPPWGYRCSESELKRMK